MSTWDEIEDGSGWGGLVPSRGDDDYDDYYDTAKKDGEPFIQGKHGGCIDRQENDAAVAMNAPRLRRDLKNKLQQKCVEWGTYWRASDAHGVQLTIGQATELLRDALGVEVEIKQ